MDMLRLCLPEILFLGLILALFLESLFLKEGIRERGRRRTAWLPLAALAVLLACCLSLGAEGSLFQHAYRIDPLSQIFKTAVAAGFMLCSINALAMRTPMGLGRVDYFLFLAISAFGLMVMCSAVEMITIYVAM